MKKILILILISLLSVVISSISPAVAQDGTSTSELLDYNGEQRGYVLYLPPNYDGSTATPLVIALHGAGSDGSTMFVNYDFSARADAAGSIVVYPDSADVRWGYVDTALPDNEGIVDDIGFINALIDHMIANYNIDQNRLYVIGHSEGGLMAYRLRCELGEQLAAVVIIQATLTYNLVRNCLDAVPVPTMLLLGTRDSVFPWDGFVQYGDDGELISSLSLTQTMGVLTSLNGCSGELNNADITASDSQVQVLQREYNNCSDDAEVILFALVNLDHEWTVNASVVLGDGLPGTLEDAIWTFLINHSLEQEQPDDLTPEPEATEGS